MHYLKVCHLVSDIDDSFLITDAKSGLLMTRKPLDRERQASYRVVIIAADLGQPPQQSARLTMINVTDVDDHKPHFTRMQVTILMRL